MNENVGASFGLSVLTVVFFAVVLYQPDSPAKPRANSPNPPPVPTAAVPEAIPSPRAAVAPAPSPTVATVQPSPRVEPKSDSATPKQPVAPPETAKPVARVRPRVETASEPRSALTQVREGETLADVARRVYGTETQAHALWRANRDLLADESEPLSPGTPLRTP